MKDYFVDLSQNADEDREPVERGIRNISVNRRGSASQRPIADPLPPLHHSRPRPRRFAIWIIAALAALLVLGVVAFAYFANTSITVTPRTHTVTFDPTSYFTAQPVEGDLSYRVDTLTLEDSDTVPAQGTEKAEDRASGNITVYNEYSTSPVRLIKNTRFQSADGHIYRTPSSIEVPGKGSAPGKMTITIIADEPGPADNVAAGRFTVPGLKGTPDMYKGVYGVSDAPFAGGFIGDRPAVTPQALDEAKSQIRTRLEDQIRKKLTEYPKESVVFPDLAVVSYESLPTTSESGSARVSERATVKVAVFDAAVFARAIAGAVSADVGTSVISLQPGTTFSATPRENLTDIGSSPLTFALNGSATLVWAVDSQLLKESLVGKDQEAFTAIVSNFPGIEKAEAHIAPFWSSRFPKEPSEIEVSIETPTP